MASDTITIIDYGVGNLLSVRQAFEYCGARVNITDKPKEIEEAEKLVLPGVGAFGYAMEQLEKRGLKEVVREYGKHNRKLLGICLGMQMLFDISEEFGINEGLGLIPGRVVRIQDTGISGKKHKVPNISWCPLKRTEGAEWKGTILEGIPEKACTYFVHSYTAIPDEESFRLADSDYNGRKISAAVRNGNIYGCQFHPEKSGETGLSIIGNFIKI